MCLRHAGRLGLEGEAFVHARSGTWLGGRSLVESVGADVADGLGHVVDGIGIVGHG